MNDEPVGTLHIYCTDLKISDISTGTHIEFGMDKEVFKEAGVKNMTDLKRITFIMGDMHYEFSKIREENVS